MKRKKPGPPPTGKGQMIGVRLQPDMLAVVDRIADQTGGTRPEVLRLAFQEWAQSYFELSARKKSNNKSVILHFRENEYEILSQLGGTDFSELAHDIICEWLTKQNYLK